MSQRSTWLLPVSMCLLSLAGAVLTINAAAQTAERARATITCGPGGALLKYDCLVRLEGRTTGQPITGASIKVAADMPSMPMAHAVRPVTAAPSPTPGVYTLHLDLEMPGEWALRLTIEGPVKDQLVEVLRFEADAVHPVGKRGRARSGSTGSDAHDTAASSGCCGSGSGAGSAGGCCGRMGGSGAGSGAGSSGACGSGSGSGSADAKGGMCARPGSAGK